MYINVYTSGQPMAMTADRNLLDYARELQQALRQSADVSAPQWRRRVEQGLARGYRGGGLEGLSAVVHVVVNTLEAAGLFDEALHELDHAEIVANESPDAVAVIRSLRSGFLLAKGRVTESTALSAELEGLVDTRLTPFARAKVVSTLAVVRLVTLDPSAKEAATLALADKAVGADEGARLFVVSWLIPFLLASGQLGAAVPWARQLRLEAEAARHRWRLADARSFELLVGLRAEWNASREEQALNPTAHFRAAAWLLRNAVLQEDWEVARKQLERLLAVAPILDDGAVGPIQNFEAVVAAHRDGGLTAAPDPGRSVHLGSMSSLLAGAEAAAYAGSQVTAMAWLGLVGSFSPARFGVEWPVSVDRIRGLLQIRAGETRAARHSLTAAVEASANAGREEERWIASLQLAELLASPGFLVSEPERIASRREAWGHLRRAGINPTAHSYVVARAIDAGRGGALLSPLSRRETEVLGLLSDGLSYKEIACSLGLKAPTVQTLAHRVYEKLGVSGRMPAAKLARELGLI